nr:transposase [Microvirga tunisiensis]
MGRARGTVRKFAQAESFPERAVRQPGPRILDPYLSHLNARLAAGSENATALRRELQDLGFAGFPKQLAWLLVLPATALDATEAAVLAWVRQDPEAATVADRAERCCTRVRQCCRERQIRNSEQVSTKAVTAWIAKARSSGIPAVETCAASPEQDGAAVRAALTRPWSSGQAEGQITRLKFLKRSMYGRASFDLLRRRVLLAA